MRPSAIASAAVLLILTAFSGCLDGQPDLRSDLPAAVDPRVAPAAWKAQLSQPVHADIVASVHRIPSVDGVELSLTLHLPDGLSPGQRIPTLLQLTPYQPLAGRTSTPLGTDDVGDGPLGGDSSWAFFVERGAAYVEADARGTGGSEGCLDFGGTADRADAATFAAWVRAQPWSNGLIVTDGISHPGMGSVVAHAAVADLTGALAHAPVVSYYRDEWYQGAKFEDQANGPGYQAIELAPPAYVEPGSLAAQADPCIGQTLLDFSALDGRHHDLWNDRDLSRNHAATMSPILMTQGFVDQNVHPDHVQLYWDALPDDAPKSVVWGWWYHGWPDLDGHPASDFADVRHRWLDHLLFGIDNGLAAEPRVLVEDSRGMWHEGHDWPLEPSLWQTLWADAGTGSLMDWPAAGAGTPSSPTPSQASPLTPGAVSYPDAVGARRGVWEGAHAAFRTEPLPRDALVNGAPVVELVASSTATATKWVVYLMDEAPDGSWQRVTHGYADSHTWAGEAAWQAMEPGKPYSWTIQLMPTAVVVEEGHRLTLVVASSDSRHLGLVEGIPGADSVACFDDHRGGCYAPSGIQPAVESHGRATNTVHTGPEGTRLHVAAVDPALTAKVPWPA